MRPMMVAIYCDCQAVIHALGSGEITSRQVKENIEALNEAYRLTGVLIYVRWVKGHQKDNKCPGNDMADKRAKESIEGNLEIALDAPAKSFASIKQLIKRKMVDHWNYRWEYLCPPDQRCRQTKAWAPKVNLKESRELLLLPRIALSRILMIKTGHNFFNYHQNLIETRMWERGLLDEAEITDPACERCYQLDIPDEDRPKETAIHLLSECDALAEFRMECFGDPYPSCPFKIKNSKILHFLNVAGLETLPMLEMQAEFDLEIEREQRQIKNPKKRRSKTSTTPNE